MTEYNLEFFKQQGSRGGKQTVKKYGKKHFSKLGVLSGQKKRKTKQDERSLKTK